MRERRESARDKVIYGGVAEIDEQGATRECIVRNISDKGASVEFSNVVNLPREQMSLRVARKGRSFLAKVVWWRDNFVGVAFSNEKLQPAVKMAPPARVARGNHSTRRFHRIEAAAPITAAIAGASAIM